MTPTGRGIHDSIFRASGFTAPVAIGILETPSGFEVNAKHGWPERIQSFFEATLSNWKPAVTRIRAWRKGGDHSTDDSRIVDAILTQDYLYCGAGSPSYAVRHLADSLALTRLAEARNRGTVLCFGSATAAAMGAFTIPVYEIFKVGEDPHWMNGTGFLPSCGVDAVIVPHWNNREGKDFDTTRCYLGLTRFASMRAMLPSGMPILGIDETTACVIDTAASTVTVTGTGSAHVIVGESEQSFRSGATFGLDLLSRERSRKSEG